MKLYHDALKVFIFDFKFNGKQLCVDAAREDGSLGRLVNDDNVNPNSKMTVTRVDGRPHLCLFAIKDIGPGEEITYNYGDSNWPWRSKKSNMVASQAVDENAASSSPNEATKKSNMVASQAVDENAASSSPNDATKDCDHDLVPDEMSSLEKCFACGGPFSPLKWSGVRCEVCYQSWHKRCYVSHKVNLTEPLPEVFSEDSSSEGASSEEEYVPDSIADSDSSWDNKSEPLNISCKQVQNSEISSSQSACKTKRPRLESFLERVGQRISEDAESISEDGIGTRQLDVSGVIATAEKSDAEGIVDDSDTTAEDSLKHPPH
ncbi:uncharacterized protein LOC120435551 [Oreochromis aureus]|uniref:uncharacterized protein LOC120435551 n=1 Tax=Oreochromis aureus TaxID=47969 RepID=UPI001954165D|nr:uncharacterized protein LOC120435551 [Oreochromis aureus]